MPFFTSDLHLGHKMVAGARRQGTYDNVDRDAITQDDIDWHDAMLAERWDAVVKPRDQVWVLGDIAISESGFLEALAWISKRPGEKILLSGNHDPTAPWRTKAHVWRKKALTYDIGKGPAFIDVTSYAEKKINGHRVALSHFPYAGSEHSDHSLEERYTEYRVPDTGKYLLHGHVHSPDRQHGREIHVGVDAWNFTPVDLEQIRKLIPEAE